MAFARKEVAQDGWCQKTIRIQMCCFKVPRESQPSSLHVQSNGARGQTRRNGGRFCAARQRPSPLQGACAPSLSFQRLEIIVPEMFSLWHVAAQTELCATFSRSGACPYGHKWRVHAAPLASHPKHMPCLYGPLRGRVQIPPSQPVRPRR